MTDFLENHPFVLVIGMHRSGTSALSELLVQLGAHPGSELLPVVEDVNARGFWENKAVLDIHERLLASLDSCWDDLSPLPRQWWLSDEVASYSAELTSLVRKELPSDRLCLVKDPRLCRLLPLWRKVLKAEGREPVCVLIYRHPIEVAESLARRDGMDPELALLFGRTTCSVLKRQALGYAEWS